MYTPARTINLIYPTGYTTADLIVAATGDITLVMPPSAAGAIATTGVNIGNYNSIIRSTLNATVGNGVAKLGYQDEVLDAWTLDFTVMVAVPVVGDEYEIVVTQTNPVTQKATQYPFPWTVIATDTTRVIMATRVYNMINSIVSSLGFTIADNGAGLLTFTSKATRGLLNVSKMLTPDTLTILNSVAGKLQRFSAAQIAASGITNMRDNTCSPDAYNDLLSFQIKVGTNSELGDLVGAIVQYNLYISNPGKTAGGAAASTVAWYDKLK